MRVSIGVGSAASGQERDFGRQVDYVVEAEKLGVYAVWSAEAWGQDAVAPLAYLAAKTDRIKLGTGIMQISARTPSMTAMTALTMAALSNDRFLLGLGVSGPQVVEGLQGRSFEGPLTRLRETIEIIRLAFQGEKLAYEGKYHTLPLPGGEGKALRLAQPGNQEIPIYLATLGPRALELTGELADGWLGTSFTPSYANAHLDFISRGAEAHGRSLGDIDIQAGGTVAFEEDMAGVMGSLKAGMAFTLGAMGSAKTNFYNDAYKRGGWEDAANEVQGLWVAGRREEAIAKVPEEMVLQSNLVGDKKAIRERLQAYKRAGVSTLRVQPAGQNLDDRLKTLGATLELIDDLD